MPKQARGFDVSALTLALNGRHTYLETVASTSPTAARNATAFTGGQCIQIQSDAACYVTAGSSTVTATAAAGLKLAADEKYMLVLGEADTHVSVLAVSGTANVKFFSLG